MGTVKVKDVIIGEGKPKVCVPMTGRTMKDLMEEAEFFTTIDIDLVEWRVDFFEHAADISKVKQAIEQIREVLGSLPIIFTFRSAKEGGEQELSIESYVELNRAVIQSGKADIVDIELFQGKETVKELSSIAKEHQVKTIVSNHDFQKTPSKEEIVNRLNEAANLGGDILKIAVMPHDAGDVLTLLQATWELKSKYTDRPLITMSMGESGIVSRLSGEIFGSSITFGAAKNASAPGQINVKDLQTVLQIIHQSVR